MIPKEQWKQLDKASHFICADRCRFTRSTVIGPYVVSTVGEFHADPSGPMEVIGWRRYYETMVFRYDGFCTKADCICGGVPNILDAGDPLDFAGYMTRAEAESGHETMCERWAEHDS